MLQHIHADHRIETGVIIGKGLAHAHVIADAQTCAARVMAGGLDGGGGRIDPGHMGAACGQRLGHEAARAAQIKYLLTMPVDMAVEPSKPPGHEVFQRPHPADVIRPPLLGNLVIDCQVIAHVDGPLQGRRGAGHRALQRGTVQTARHSGRKSDVPSGAEPRGNRW